MDVATAPRVVRVGRPGVLSEATAATRLSALPFGLIVPECNVQATAVGKGNRTTLPGGGLAFWSRHLRLGWGGKQKERRLCFMLFCPLRDRWQRTREGSLSEDKSARQWHEVRSKMEHSHLTDLGSRSKRVSEEAFEKL